MGVVKDIVESGSKSCVVAFPDQRRVPGLHQVLLVSWRLRKLCILLDRSVAFPLQQDMIAPRERSRSPKRSGKIAGLAKRWNDDKGFGFIKPDDGSEDLFCHRTSIEDGDCLIEGAQVWFVKGWDDRKNKEKAEQVTGGSTRGSGGGAPPPMPVSGAGAAPGAPAGYYGLPPP